MWLCKIKLSDLPAVFISGNHSVNIIQTQYVRIRIYCIYKTDQQHKLVWKLRKTRMHRRHCKNTQKILLPLKQKKIKIILHENKLRFFCTSSWDIYHEFLQLTGRDILSNHSTNIFINKTYKTSINTIFLKKIFHAHLNGGYKGWRSPVWGFGRDTGRCCAAYLSLAS